MYGLIKWPNESDQLIDWLITTITGFKFDLRLYVGVTCFDPVRIYLYEEGLTRWVRNDYLLAELIKWNLLQQVKNFLG